MKIKELIKLLKESGHDENEEIRGFITYIGNRTKDNERQISASVGLYDLIEHTNTFENINNVLHINVIMNDY